MFFLKKIFEDIEKEKLYPLYLLISNEFSLLSEIIEKIKEKYLGLKPDFSAISKIDLSEKNVDFDNVLNSLREIHLFGGKILVIAKNFESKKHGAKLLSMSKKQPETSLLILMSDNSIMKDATFIHNFQKVGKVYEIKPLRPQEIFSFIQDLAREYKLNLNREAIFTLIDLCGEEYYPYINAMEKLKLFKGMEKEIKSEDIEQLIHRSRSHTIFQLTDAIVEGDFPKSLKILQRLIEDGEEPLMITSLLERHFKNLLMVKSQIDKGLDVEEYSSTIGIHPYACEKYEKQVKKLLTEKIVDCFESLLDAEYDLRLNPSSPLSILTSLSEKLLKTI